MNNSTLDQQSTITEADALLWLRNRAASFGIDGLTLNVSSRDSYNFTAWIDKPGTYSMECGPSFEAAVKKLKSPKDLAAEKRAAARKLLEEAEQLNPTK